MENLWGKRFLLQEVSYRWFFGGKEERGKKRLLHCLAVFPVRVTQIGWNQAENQVPRRDFAWQTTGRGGVISRSLSSPTFIGGEEQYLGTRRRLIPFFIFFLDDNSIPGNWQWKLGFFTISRRRSGNDRCDTYLLSTRTKDRCWTPTCLALRVHRSCY